MRTLRSLHAVATMGRLGWGDESHVRVLEGGVSVASATMLPCTLILVYRVLVECAKQD